MMADSSVVVSSSLSRGNFRGPIQYAVWKSMKRDILPDVSPLTLDLNTAHPNLVLANSCTCVAHSFKRQKVPNNPERFQGRFGVLGSEGFAREKHYWEVDVGERRPGKWVWSRNPLTGRAAPCSLAKKATSSSTGLAQPSILGPRRSWCTWTMRLGKCPST